MDIKKIVYFVSAPFSDRDYERFGIETVQKNGYEIEVWDFSSFLGFERAEYSGGSNRHGLKMYKRFSNMKDVVCQIRNLKKDCMVILLLSYIYESYPVFRAISRGGLSYALVYYNFPSHHMEKSKGFIRKMRNFSFAKLFNLLFARYIPYWTVGIKPAKLFMSLGGESRLDKSRLPLNKDTTVIFSHYFDYDIYLKELQKPAVLDKRAGVFLDTFLPFHPDFGPEPVIDPDEYYPRLCKFFDLLEKEHQIKIIIAAHPRSNYETRRDYFGGRKVAKGKTAELVRNSGLVISQESASVSFAVLFEKPVIFVTFEKLRGKMTGKLTDFIAGLLGKETVNLNGDLNIDWDREMSVNKEAYRGYRNTYIKEEGTEELPIWQTFADNIKNG